MMSDRKRSGASARADISPPPGSRQSASFWHSLRMVGWGFLGVRKNSEYHADLGRVNPFHVILSGAIAAVLLIAGLVAVAHWAVATAPPA